MKKVRNSENSTKPKSRKIEPESKITNKINSSSKLISSNTAKLVKSPLNNSNVTSSKTEKVQHDDEFVVTNSLDEPGSSTSKKKNERGKRKRKIRKRSDPAVRTVAELFNNSLTIVSPVESKRSGEKKQFRLDDASLLSNSNSSSDFEKSPNFNIAWKTHKKSKHEEVNKLQENTQIGTADKKRVDAFEYLMNNRNKTIGQNASGGSAEERVEDEDDKLRRERKDLNRKKLQSMLERKVDLKRKRLEEEAKDQYIGKQLDKRAKKLKAMLKIKSNNKKNKKNTCLSDSESTVTCLPDDIKLTISTNAKTNTPDQSINKSSLHSTSTSTSLDRKDSSTNIQSRTKTNRSILEEKIQKDASRSMTPINKSSQWKMKIKLTPLDANTDLDVNSNPGSGVRASAGTNKEVYMSCNSGNCKEHDIDDRNGEVLLISDQENENTPVRSVKKFAPIFFKQTSKERGKKEKDHARKQFLFSNIPTGVSKRKDVTNQERLQDREHIVFPLISHIQQKTAEQIWNLPNAGLNLASSHNCYDCSHNLKWNLLMPVAFDKSEDTIPDEFRKVALSKQLINHIKRKNTHYPVYKCFKGIYSQSGLQYFNKNKCSTSQKGKEASKQSNNKDRKQKTPQKKRRSNKKKVESDNDDNDDDNKNNHINPYDFMMWTEKYKPSTSEIIMGNGTSISQLKKWLDNWSDGSRSERKRKYSSESDFEYSDDDSRSRNGFLKNCIVLEGPNGSGKSSAVYAVCNELGFNLLELNASSKRTGKRLLQELQEATQSHQVHKTDFQPLSHFIKIGKTKNEVTPQSTSSCMNKISVLLVEDVDVVYDQDDGFLTALWQLITTSKRPIILTTTDLDSSNMQRFVSRSSVLSFRPLTARNLAPWLQLLCLVEGVPIKLKSISGLLESYDGDVRRTLLHLQFFVQSGGNRKSGRRIMKCGFSEKVYADEPEINDSSDVSCVGSETEKEVDEKLHVHFQSLYYDSDSVSCMSVGKVWWNMSSILGMSQNNSDQTIEKKSDLKSRIQLISSIYDSIILTDSIFGRKSSCLNLDYDLKMQRGKLKDSLELEERLEEYNGNIDSSRELCQFLTERSIDLYRSRTETTTPINLGRPTLADKKLTTGSWKKELMTNVLFPGHRMNSRALAVDFAPTLRCIARAERDRVPNTNKRRNRFNHYLSHVGFECDTAVFHSMCDVLDPK